MASEKLLVCCHEMLHNFSAGCGISRQLHLSCCFTGTVWHSEMYGICTHTWLWGSLTTHPITVAISRNLYLEMPGILTVIPGVAPLCSWQVHSLPVVHWVWQYSPTAVTDVLLLIICRTRQIDYNTSRCVYLPDCMTVIWMWSSATPKEPKHIVLLVPWHRMTGMPSFDNQEPEVVCNIVEPISPEPEVVYDDVEPTSL